jgi:peptidoglycan/xylan/chitin deacetylase (PgdA/CDA1 family)
MLRAAAKMSRKSYGFVGMLVVAAWACHAPPPMRSPVPAPAAPLTASAEGPIRVAVTVDDLPRHGPLPPGTTRLAVHERLLAAFADHEVPSVYGFVNAAGTVGDADATAALQAWTAAGHPLGNHTLSHVRMAEVGLPAYLAEIDANDAALTTWMPDPASRKMFRYPYLFEGHDPAATAAVREHLAAGGYRIAEVTIDFYDWAFNAPYARCLQLGDQEAIAALRSTFVQHAVRMLQWSEAAARQIWGRPVPHVLLLHIGAFDAEMIDDVLTVYERLGVEWITLEEALDDPIYADLPTAPKVTQGTLIENVIEAHEAEHPPWPEHPEALLGVVCPVSDGGGAAAGP